MDGGREARCAVTPELLIAMAGLIADRERKGPKWCEKWGVGKRRELIGATLPENVGDLSGYVEAQRSAAEILESHCKVCRRCKLGTE